MAGAGMQHRVCTLGGAGTMLTWSVRMLQILQLQASHLTGAPGVQDLPMIEKATRSASGETSMQPCRSC